MMFRSKTSSGFFEERYQAEPDPWSFETSPYEQSRFRAIIRSLEHRRYCRAFEPGCSIGVLTERLADICHAIEACDFSPTAVELARARCRHLHNVTIRCDSLNPGTGFQGFDLIVLSEIGYYFRLSQWQSMVAQLVASIPAGTIILASHWVGTSPDHRIAGDAVHTVLLAHPDLIHEHGERHQAFRLDRLARA